MDGRTASQPNLAVHLFTQNSSISNQSVPKKDITMSDTKTPEVKVPEIKQDVRDLAAKLNITVDPKTGTATQAEAIADLLPEDISVEQYKRVHAFGTTLAAAQTLAHGEATVPVMKKHGDLAASTLEVVDPAGNKFSSTFYRTKLTGAPGGEKTEKFGSTVTSIELKAARKTGSLGTVRAHLSALATKQLASK